MFSYLIFLRTIDIELNVKSWDQEWDKAIRDSELLNFI